MWENVKNLLSKKHKHNFDAYIETMNILGYNSYYQVLNAKDYGIPQNRERVYTISIRKDIDKGNFVFPNKEELKLRLKDMLENEVKEKYYLKDYQIENIKNSNFIQKQKIIQEKDYCDILCSRDWKDPKCVQVANLKGGKWDKINESCRRVYSEEGISPTVHTCQGGNTELKVLEEKTVERTPLKFLNRNQKNIEGDYAFCVDSSNTGGIKETEKVICLNTKNKNGIQTHQQDRIYDTNGIMTTISAELNGRFNIKENIKIRKLTPKECWRLMGFDDEDFESAALYNSNTQLYKQAGNSIVVNVLEKILINLFNNNGDDE